MHEKPVSQESVYTLYRRGVELLEDGSFAAATEPLAEAARREPAKSSVREALGRAFFGAQEYREAAQEFQAVVDRAPVNHYALFCLGRSRQILGRKREAIAPLTQAHHLRPNRRDSSVYLERARRAA